MWCRPHRSWRRAFPSRCSTPSHPPNAWRCLAGRWDTPSPGNPSAWPRWRDVPVNRSGHPWSRPRAHGSASAELRGRENWGVASCSLQRCQMLSAVFFAEQFIDAEEAFQLQRGPVVECEDCRGVCGRPDLGPGEEFFLPPVPLPVTCDSGTPLARITRHL